MGEQRPTVQRLQLGSALRRAREAAHRRQEDAAEVLDCNVSKISRIENGRSGLRAAELEKLLDFYGFTGRERDELLSVGKIARKRERRKLYGDSLPGWFRRYIDLEEEATEIRSYEGELVPGLLQIEPYARALVRSSLFGMGQDEVDRRVQLRLDRQTILERTSPLPPRQWYVLGEAALRRPIGERGVLRRQLEHLLDLTVEPTRITVQILPFAAGEHAALGTSFSLLSLGTPAPEVGFIDALGVGANYPDREQVTYLIEVFDRLRANALGVEESRSFLDRVRKET